MVRSRGLRPEFGHFAGVGHCQEHDVGRRYAADGTVAATSFAEGFDSLTLGEPGVQHEGDRVPAVPGDDGRVA